jgi:hypothetical protein
MAQYLIEKYANIIDIYDHNGDVVYGVFLDNALEGPPEILRMLVTYPNLEWQYMIETAVEKKLYEALDILLEAGYTTDSIDSDSLDYRMVEIFNKYPVQQWNIH